MIPTNFQSTHNGGLSSAHTSDMHSPGLVKLTVSTHSIRELHSFWTEHELHPSAHSVDSYTFRAFGLVVDPATNLSVDIGRFAVANSLDWFTISSRSARAVEGFTYDTASGPTTVEMGSSTLEVEIRRSESAKALNMCIFATNWILTLVTAYIAGKAATNRRVDFATVVFHGSIALVIPSIRKLYIDPPPFGAFPGTLAVSTLIRCLTGGPPRHCGIFLTNRHRGHLFRGVGVRRIEAVSVDRGVVPRSWEGVKVRDPQEVGGVPHNRSGVHRM